MSTMQTELYDALIDAGASEDKARDAARAAALVAADYPRAGEVVTINYIDGKIEKLEWMVGVVIALVIGVLLAVLFQ